MRSGSNARPHRVHLHRPRGPWIAIVIALFLAVPLVPSGPAPPEGRPASAPPFTPAANRTCVPSARACPPSAGPHTLTPAASGDGWTNVTTLQRFSPTGVYGASMAFDPSDNYLLLFGGCSATACPVPAQTWKYAGGAWTVVTTSTAAPPARERAAMTYDHADGYVVLFGGANQSGVPRADTWRFQLGTWKNETGTTGTAPPARSGAAISWDDTDGYAVLFGGRNATGAPLGDTWQFARGKWNASVITSPTQPPARADAVLTYYGSSNAAFLFGGTGANGLLDDLWKFAADAWTNETAAAAPIPTGRLGAASPESTLYWSASGVKNRVGFLVVFGGAVDGCLTCARPADNDTWVFEPTLTSSATVVPSVVEVGEPASFSAVGTGGTTPYVFAWQFGDGATSASSTPSHAYATVRAYTANVSVSDAAGVQSRATTSIMVLSGPAVTARVEPRFTDVGRPVAYNATTSGGTAPYSTRWSFGDGLGFTGATTTHAYESAGTFVGNVTVTDAALGVGVVPFSLTVNATLVLAVTAPTSSVPAGDPATFTATPTLGTPPYSAVWTFGDGAQAFSLGTTHTYATGGTYNVSVRVSDAVGATRWQNLTVDVSAAPGTPAGKILGLPSGWFPWIAGGAAAAAIALVALFIVRRRRRRTPDVPIAAAAAGEGGWNEDGSSGVSSESRSSRRARRH